MPILAYGIQRRFRSHVQNGQLEPHTPRSCGTSDSYHSLLACVVLLSVLVLALERELEPVPELALVLALERELETVLVLVLVLVPASHHHTRILAA